MFADGSGGQRPTDAGAIRIEVDLLDKKKLEALKISAKGLWDEIRRAPQSWGSIWPGLSAYNGRLTSTPTLVLVPLERLGASQGASGNRVVIGYFRIDEVAIDPSLPMVVKISEPTQSTKLDAEKRSAEAVKAYARHPAEFAFPLDYGAPNTDCGVLWSPFISARPDLDRVPAGAAHRLELTLTDLATCLRNRKRVGKILSEVFESLSPVHRRNGAAAVRSLRIFDEYQRYLRQLDDWAMGWEKTWGPRQQRDLHNRGTRAVNPLWVMNELKGLPCVDLYCGAVHGDLHPRNIVLSERGPCIIDFGWSSDDGHVAKDFVLLECNLRFMFMPADVPRADLEMLSGWLDFQAKPPLSALEDSACKSHGALIQRVRGRAREVFPRDTKNWDEQYVIPLFLVALGLLKHLRDADNQLSAILTVEKTAEHIAQYLEKRGKH